MSIVVKVCIWVIDFYDWRFLERSLLPLSFVFIVKLLCSCSSLFDVSIELQPIDENSFNCFFQMESERGLFIYVNKGLFIFLYVVEAFMTSN